MKHSIRYQFTALVTAGAMLVGPVLPAFADNLDYNTLCGTSAISDVNKTYCAQADTARTTEKYQKMKEVLMLAAGATLTALGLIPFGAGEPPCKIVAVSTDVAGLGLDVAQSLQEGSISSSMLTGISSIGSIAISTGFKNEIMANAADSITKHTAMQSEKKAGCLVSAGLSFVQAGFSMIAVSSAKKAEQSALSSVSSIDASRTSNGFAVGTGAGQAVASTGSSGSAQNASAASCATDTGNAYLNCVAKTDPEVAAITADPNLVSAVQQALGGQSLGDLAKNYTGDGSSASASKYVGDAMGLSSTGDAALKSALDKSANVAGDGAYTAAKYVSNGTSKAGAGGGENVDFSKMMDGMLSKLNPDGSDKKTGDASAVVFRQLDLLSPDKIAANKDISLFARIGYRYRKKSADVDQLNWSAPTNQTSSTTSVVRNPASKN